MLGRKFGSDVAQWIRAPGRRIWRPGGRRFDRRPRLLVVGIFVRGGRIGGRTERQYALQLRRFPVLVRTPCLQSILRAVRGKKDRGENARPGKKVSHLFGLDSVGACGILMRKVALLRRKLRKPIPRNADLSRSATARDGAMPRLWFARKPYEERGGGRGLGALSEQAKSDESVTFSAPRLQFPCT